MCSRNYVLNDKTDMARFTNMKKTKQNTKNIHWEKKIMEGKTNETKIFRKSREKELFILRDYIQTRTDKGCVLFIGTL